MAKKRSNSEAFVMHRLSLLMSHAWQNRPVPVMRLLERLEIEHLRHGGQENGNLYVSYAQLQTSGLSRRTIRPAIDCGAALGLLRAEADPDFHGGDLRQPNRYALLYLPVKNAKFPTDEWRNLSPQQVEQALERFRSATGIKSSVSPRKRISA
ncbi:hypothetical protein [Pannonibacter tanglangensis]|uniref:Uncharacterized protein n=1 Tax=Pannonibacter tanglangensis TaxID=2750084 RepID=A0ABW9ZLB6_9HYPH|nr:hypothetical protein [Pannonibacter sp. XCT-34]NBN63827.1 hypothetical protein [Pannonibacter sp. XCT-34]